MLEVPNVTEERLEALLDAPFEVEEYERWLKSEQPADDHYLFAEKRARFHAANRDKLRRPDDLSVVSAKSGIELRSASLGGGIGVPGVSRSAAERVLSMIDGEHSVAELRILAGAERPALERMLQSALGFVLFAPEAVTELEQAISGIELVRFVGTPYEIVRNYWANMADVRRAAKASLDSFENDAGAIRWLRRLHVLALMGANLDRFYRPASRIASQGLRPGALYRTESERLETSERTLLLAGPRVGVGLAGGEIYYALVCAGDPDALAQRRTMRDADGLDWGSVVQGRALDDAKDAAWFCPPRPLRPEHFLKLFDALSNARRSTKPFETHGLQHIARFHYRFMRLHPFRAANQSLCMNLVNLVLGEQGVPTIPHLLLDQFALRLSEPDYVRVFARAIRAHGAQGSGPGRWAELRAIKERSYALITRLKGVEDLATARTLADEDPEAASAALIEVRDP